MEAAPDKLSDDLSKVKEEQQKIHGVIERLRQENPKYEAWFNRLASLSS